MKKWVYGFFMSWGMFLWIPCPFPKWDEEARREMLVCLPFIGGIIGGLWALLLFLLKAIGCPAPAAAVLLTAFPWVMSGFIHLDGFMDVCDAILSRRDLETRQKILKDPHCGAFAVIGMVLLALASFGVFLSADIEKLLLLPLALIPFAARACAGIAVLLLKPMGTSQYSGKVGGKAGYAAALFVLLAAAIALPIVLYGIKGLAPAAAATVYWLSALRGKKQLGGMNGDISGYALSLGELFGIAALVFVR
jgi:adenosylcobinamide-GDP ribazoletransferase